MAIVVEHEKRRKEILERALTVFVEDGFENATFQKIADRCGITRTILYLYFKNKTEIFNFSIKQLLQTVEEKLIKTSADKTLNCSQKITGVLIDVFELLEQNQQLLSVVLNYLLHLSKSGVNPEDRIRRRTVKLRHILSSIIMEGKKKGEIKKINVKSAREYLYTLVESAIFQLVVLKHKDLKDLKETVTFAVKLFEV